MPILTKEVIVKWQRANKKFYENQGYLFNGVGKEFNVKVEHLGKSDITLLDCICDECGTPFQQCFKNSPNLFNGIVKCKNCSMKNRNHFTIFDEIDIKKITKLYHHEKKSLPQIAIIYNTTPSTISKFMDKHNISKRTISEANTMEVDEEKIIDLYSNHLLSSIDISNLMNISIPKIISVLENNKAQIRNRSEATKSEKWQKQRRKVYIEKEILEDLYITKGFSSLEIAKLYNVEPENILGLLHHYNIEVRKLDEIFKDESFRSKLKRINNKKFGADSFMESNQFHIKAKQTFQSKYNVNNPFELDEIQQKAKESLYKNGNVNTSMQQLYIHNLLGGKLNYPINRINVDILFNDKIYLEVNFGGHNLSVKLGNITQEEFDKKELKRNLFLKSKGYRRIEIISRKDYLPSDEIILSIIQYAKDFLTNTPRSWITFDIDNKIIKTSKYTISYDYGKLRKIKKSDLPTQSA